MSCCGEPKGTIEKAIKTTRRIILKAAVSQDRLLRHIQRWRQPEDKGLGDTLKHIADDLGGKQFAEWLKKWGVDCGCEDERAYWNEKLPYDA